MKQLVAAASDFEERLFSLASTLEAVPTFPSNGLKPASASQSSTSTSSPFLLDNMISKHASLIF